MIFRERQEKVAFARLLTRVAASFNGLDADKVFGGVLADYAFEVFQETYDADLLARKAKALREARARVISRRKADQRLLKRLDLLGTYYDKSPDK